MTVNEFAQDVHKNAVAHGWYDAPITFPEVAVMIHAEISEAVEEWRSGNPVIYGTCALSPENCKFSKISSWGWEWKNGSRLSDLLLAICQAAPTVRIRLGSLEPRTIDEDFCKTLSTCRNLCPQFHLSLQSGSDTVLKRMNRKYDTQRYLESVS